MVTIRRERSVPVLMDWRREVIMAVFGVEPGRELMEANRRYYERHLAEGTHLAFIASEDGADCGCGAVCVTEEMPSPDNLTGRCAYLMNIYVRGPFRNNGVAHAIVRRLIEEARRLDCDKISLETTPDGRPVYLSLGFRDMPDQMKYSEPAP